MCKLVKQFEFRNFQKKTSRNNKKDVQMIRNSNQNCATDKNSNYKKKQYIKLKENFITKTYKKSNYTVINSIKN